MASSTLDPDNDPIRDRVTGRGHGTRQLGPSDSSDSGSDVQGSMRWAGEADIGLDKGTSEDPDSARADRSAGPDLGDAWLDSDTDASGSGEAASAGRDAAIRPETAPDRIDYIDAAAAGESEWEATGEEGEDALPAPPQAERKRSREQSPRR